MIYWTGALYTSGTLVASGNSGWFSVPIAVSFGGMRQAILRLVPANLATDETMDLDLNIGWDITGSGDVKVHDFTQVNSTNAAETLILPGGESVGNLTVGADLLPSIIPPFWKLTWTLAGTTKSMNFTLWAIIGI